VSPGGPGLAKLGLGLLLLGGAVFWLGRADWSDPEAVLTRFLEARYATDVETVYEHLCAADRAVKSFDQFKMLHGVDDSVYVAPIIARSTFEIERMEVDGARATATVRVSEPDMRIAMNRLLSDAMATAAEGGSPASLDASLASKAAGLNVPMIESTRRFSLVRSEADGWRVDLRLDVRDEVDRLLVRAEHSSERGDLESARELFEQALALDDNRIEILDRIEDVEHRMLPVAEQRRRERQAMDEVLGKIREERASRRW
jgi:tetratricopeptide (TPR) repeat protein